MLTKDLIDFGLSEKEAKVYIALLELEISPVNEIAKKAEINRSTVYVTLNSLIGRGLVSITENKNVQQYSAVSPEAILREAEARAQKYEIIRSNIEKIIPEMKALHKDTKQKPMVKVFEGKESMITSLAETLSSKEKLVRICSSAKMLFEIIPEFLPIYAEKRVALGVEIKAIFPLTKETKDLVLILPKLYSAVYIPENKYAIPADIAIWDNKIGYSIIQDKKITTIIIESLEIAEIMKSIFDMAYNEGVEIGEKVVYK